MALPAGTRMPAFKLEGSDGRAWSDADLRGEPYVLTFYPKDETPGCTAQMCAFRDAWEDLKARGIKVFGVSRDSVESHRTFVKNQSLPYVLLADEKAELHKALQIGKTLFGGANRVSFFVDEAGIIREAYQDNLRFSAHAEKMLVAARAL